MHEHRLKDFELKHGVMMYVQGHPYCTSPGEPFMLESSHRGLPGVGQGTPGAVICRECGKMPRNKAVPSLSLNKRPAFPAASLLISFIHSPFSFIFFRYPATSKASVALYLFPDFLQQSTFPAFYPSSPTLFFF